jgi:hypothetical protein
MKFHYCTDNSAYGLKEELGDERRAQKGDDFRDFFINVKLFSFQINKEIQIFTQCHNAKFTVQNTKMVKLWHSAIA